MNRAERRKQEKTEKRAIAEIPEWKKWEIMARMETKARLLQNGITQKDLQDAYDRGWREATKANVVDEHLRYMQEFFYSACAVAAHDVYGFGKDRCERLLHRVAEIMNEEISTGDIIERCLRETGVDVNVEEWTI